MEIQPLHDRVLVQRAAPPETTAGGLFVPTSSTSESNEAIVMAVGPGVESPLTVGTRVLLGKFAGDDVTVGSEKYILVPETDILAIIGGAQ